MIRSGLRYLPVVLLAVVVLTFAAIDPGFLAPRNIANIFVQSSSLAIIAAGLTFVLITAGIDLSVGSIMFLSAAIAGKLVLAGQPLAVALFAVLAVGVLCGALSGFLVTRFSLPPFIVTLALLYAERGLALYITQTRAMNLPEQLLQIFTGSFLGVPVPVWILAIATVTAQIALSRTLWGRQIYAVGQSKAHALLAGIPVQRRIFLVYVISGFAAALGGLVSVAQLGAVSPTFGYQREFAAIAAAVLGGTSLFGGRGKVLPGTVLGAVLIQTVENGLVMLNADPYLYPLVMAVIIFTAVFLDAQRTWWLQRESRRRIRPVTASAV